MEPYWRRYRISDGEMVSEDGSLSYDSRVGDVENRTELSETDSPRHMEIKDKGNRMDRYTTQGPIKRTWE